MNLFVVANTSQFISISGTSSFVNSFNAGVSSNQIYVFKAISSTVWKLFITPSYISQEKTYTEAAFLITQTGTSNPTLTTIYNNTGVVFTTSYNGIGSYDIFLSTPINLSKTMSFIQSQYQQIGVTCVNLTTTQMNIRTFYTTSGVTLDGAMTNTCFSVKIYN
jgi:hypothetical protein